MAIRLAPSILASDFSRLRDETHRCKQAGAELTDIGQVGGSSLKVEGLFDARISDLREAWKSAIPQLVGEGIHQAALERVL